MLCDKPVYCLDTSQIRHICLRAPRVSGNHGSAVSRVWLIRGAREWHIQTRGGRQ
jgi:hypothetical protein